MVFRDCLLLACLDWAGQIGIKYGRECGPWRFAKAMGLAIVLGFYASLASLASYLVALDLQEGYNPAYYLRYPLEALSQYDLPEITLIVLCCLSAAFFFFVVRSKRSKGPNANRAIVSAASPGGQR